MNVDLNGRVKLQAIVTGEIGGNWSVLANNNLAPKFRKSSKYLPYGYREEITWSDGTVTDGVVKPVPIWYIETADARILVDTSFENADDLVRLRLRQGFSSYIRRKPEWEIGATLSRIDVRPEDIDIVILTHCHFDHIGCNGLFPRARFFAHPREIALAMAPPHYAAAHYLPEYSRHIVQVHDRLTLLTDEQVIVPGVRVWRAGGHSPGSMVVMVATPQGPAAIMGDVMHDYINLEYWWPGTGNNIWCIDEQIQAYSRVRAEAAIVLPGHDWKLWTLYPEGRIIQ